METRAQQREQGRCPGVSSFADETFKWEGSAKVEGRVLRPKRSQAVIGPKESLPPPAARQNPGDGRQGPRPDLGKVGNPQRATSCASDSGRPARSWNTEGEVVGWGLTQWACACGAAKDSLRVVQAVVEETFWVAWRCELVMGGGESGLGTLG